MGKNVTTNATVITIHNSVITCADAYKSQLQRITSQPTPQMKYPRIISTPVFLLLTQALIVEVCSLYLNDDNDDNEQKFDKINTDVVLSYSAETCSTDTSSDSTGWDERKLILLQICFFLICYYCKFIYKVLAKEVQFCFDLVCYVVCC